MNPSGATDGPSGAGYQPTYSKVTAASEDRTKFVKGTGSGKQKSRLSLTDNATYRIAAKKIDITSKSAKLQEYNPIHQNRYVRVKQGDETFDVNVRSAAKRLGISKKEVRKLAKGEGGLTRMQERTKVRDEAIKRYGTIIEKYAKQKGKLQTKEGGEKTGLRPKTLLKIIQKGLDIGEGDKVKERPQEIIADRQFVRISEGGEISILQKTLGSGSFGAVFQTFNINKAKAEAMKEADVNQGSANEQLQNEYDIHSLLRDGDVTQEIEGIQSAPREVTIIGEGETQKAFYQTDLAQGDIHASNPKMALFNALPVGHRLKLCGQLINGLQHAHGKNVVHGDIKPENCLMRADKNGLPEKFGLADFGGAAIGKSSQVSTSDYRPSDYVSSQESPDEGKKGDIFALSMSLVEVLSGGKRPALQTTKIRGREFPIAIDPNSEIAEKIKENLKANGISKEIANVLIAGLGPKEQRPTADELKEAYETAISSVPEEEVDTDMIQKLQQQILFQEALESMF